MASSTKWRLNVSANNGYSGNLVVGDLELRTAAGVPRPFVHDTFAATVVDAGAASLQGIASLSTISGFLYAWEQVTFPFTVYFGGVGYTKCFVSPNGYIYFDVAGDPNGYEYNPLNGKDPAAPHIILGDGTLNGNSSIHALYAGAETSGTTFRMRLEMNAATTDSTTAVTIWEVTFDSGAPNTVRIDFGTCGQSTPLAAIGDGKYKPYVATFPTVVNKRYNVTTTVTTADGTPTASTNIAGGSGSVYTADQAADVDTDTYWEASAATGWWQYEYTSAQAVVEYVVTSPSTWWNEHTALLKDWTLEYWDGAAWVVADTQTGQSSWGFSESRTYTVGVPYGTTPVTINGAVNIADRDNTAYMVPAAFLLSGSMLSSIGGTPPVDPPVVVPPTIDGAANLGNPNNAGAGPGFDATPWTLTTDLSSSNSMDGAANIGDPENYGVAFQKSAWATSGLVNSGTVSNGAVALSLNTPWGMAGTILSEQVNVADGSVALPQWVSAAVLLPGMMAAGDVQLAVLAAPWSLSATLLSEDIITGEAYLPLYDAAGSLEPALALPTFTLVGTVLPGTVAAGATLLLDFEADGAIVSGTSSDGAVVLPFLDAAGSDGITPDFTLPYLTLSGVAIPGTVASAALTLSALSAQGTLLQDSKGDGAMALNTYTLVATGFSDNVAFGAVALPAATAQGTGLAGNTISGAATVPLMSVSADGFTSNIGSAYISLPPLTVEGTMALVASAGAPEVLGLVLNTHTNAATHYSNMPFNSMCNFNGVVLAASAAGIVALVGDTDNGVDIDAFFEVGRSDFGSPQLKRVTAGYAGYQASGSMRMTVITDDHHEYNYTLAPRNAEIPHIAGLFGRGLRSRYWQWRLANVAGADFLVDSMSLDVENLSRPCMSERDDDAATNEPVATGWLHTRLHGDEEAAAGHIQTARALLGSMRTIHGVNERIAAGDAGGFYRQHLRMPDGTLIEATTNDGFDSVRIDTPFRAPVAAQAELTPFQAVARLAEITASAQTPAGAIPIDTDGVPATHAKPILEDADPVLTSGEPIEERADPIHHEGTPIYEDADPIVTGADPILNKDDVSTELEESETEGKKEEEPVLTDYHPYLWIGARIVSGGKDIHGAFLNSIHLCVFETQGAGSLTRCCRTGTTSLGSLAARRSTRCSRCAPDPDQHRPEGLRLSRLQAGANLARPAGRLQRPNDLPSGQPGRSEHGNVGRNGHRRPGQRSEAAHPG